MPKKKTAKDVAKKNVLSGVEKQALFNNAKKIKQSLQKEIKRYQNAKVNGKTAEYYQRAIEMAKEDVKKYSQRAVRARLGKDSAVNEKLIAEAAFLKSFGGGNVATNVARRLLQQKSDEMVSEKLSTAGARFYGGLVGIWYDEDASDEQKSADYSQRNKKIVQAFGKKNLLQVIEQIEDDLHINLAEELSKPEKYAEIVNQINAYVKERGLDEE